MPDLKMYSVAGRMQAGMDYAYTGHDETGEITYAETVRFLEGGALCMSSDDYLREKNAREKLCYNAGSSCTYEMKQTMSEVDQRVTALIARSKRKKH